MTSSTQPSYNLTIPVYTHRSTVEPHWMDSATRDAYQIQHNARSAALLALFRAVCPNELASMKATASNAPYGLFRFLIDPEVGYPAIEVSEPKMRSKRRGSVIEIRIDNGYGSRRAFRRVSVDPDTGALDPRTVTAIKETIAEAQAIITRSRASQAAQAKAAAAKKEAFAYATKVFESNGLSPWQYDNGHGEGSLRIGGRWDNEIAVKGRTMTVTLSEVDVDKLPEVLAVIRALGLGKAP